MVNKLFDTQSGSRFLFVSMVNLDISAVKRSQLVRAYLRIWRLDRELGYCWLHDYSHSRPARRCNVHDNNSFPLSDLARSPQRAFRKIGVVVEQ